MEASEEIFTTVLTPYFADEHLKFADAHLYFAGAHPTLPVHILL